MKVLVLFLSLISLIACAKKEGFDAYSGAIEIANKYYSLHSQSKYEEACKFLESMSVSSFTDLNCNESDPFYFDVAAKNGEYISHEIISFEIVGEPDESEKYESSWLIVKATYSKCTKQDEFLVSYLKNKGPVEFVGYVYGVC